MLAPICLFTYNRLEETKLTVQSLQNNFLASNSELYIFSDGAKHSKDEKTVQEVRNYLKTINGFKNINIVESSINKGLANSIIDGVTEIVERFGKIIVLEDDLYTTPNFLDFMNQALNFYHGIDGVKSINGYSLFLKGSTKDLKNKVYFQSRPFPWGWATWKEEWKPQFFYSKKDYENILNKRKFLKSELGNDIPEMLNRFLTDKNNSWYVRYAVQHLIENKVSVYPCFSKVENIGFGENGTHCRNINSYISKVDTKCKRSFNFSKKIEVVYKMEFLWQFTKKHKIIYRIKLLNSHLGRKKVLNELLSKITRLK